ncbi:hypothetical protein MBLNU457_g0701t1 [Dothideomycetes sp. NU457]
MFRSILSLLIAFTVTTQAISLDVAANGGNASSSMMYGIMFEDINHSGDGGIYAELIQNRAFQGNATLAAWSPVGGASLALTTSNPLSSALPTSVQVAAGGHGQIGIQNSGWWGISVKQQPYHGSFWVYGSYHGVFTASLVSNSTGKVFGSTKIVSKGNSGWTQYNYTLFPRSAAPDVANVFTLTYAASGGSLQFNLISLFPPTYHNRPNGNRPDLMSALDGLNPSFLRLPGGNNLEGNSPPNLWKWNQTIGPLKNRPGRPGTWGYENTDGLGLIEYMHWCQDLNMEPILAVWSGLYLDGTVIPEDQLQPYVQFALDELEFLMGDASTTYGTQRIALGYPQPFPIKYVEVGNEDNLWGGLPSYSTYRFQMFYDAISKAYPEIEVIASTVAFTLPGNADGDYHEYALPDQLVSQFNFFDNQNNSVHKTLVGEIAVKDGNMPGPNAGVNYSLPGLQYPEWIGSVAEAVFFLGMERNGDKVIGAAYAPLLENVNSIQWQPDLISFNADPDQTALSTSWHVISLLSSKRIAQTLPISGAEYDPAFYVSGTSASGGRLFKAAVYNSTDDVDFDIKFDGVAGGASATLTTLTAPSGFSMNAVGGPNVVKTSTFHLTADGAGVFHFTLPDLSVAVLEVQALKGYSRVMAREYVERGH